MKPETTTAKPYVLCSRAFGMFGEGRGVNCLPQGEVHDRQGEKKVTDTFLLSCEDLSYQK